MKRGLLFTISALLLALAVAWPVQTLALRPPAVTGTPLYLPLVLKQATFTPLPTATPTRTPTPTATTLPPGVSVLDSHSYFIDSINYLHIVGEVFNNTTDHLRFVKITANLFNGAQLVATDFTFTHLDHLPAGEKTCFSVSLEQPANWTAYQFESPTYLTMGEPLPNLPLLNVSSSIDPTFGWHEIIGQVRNDHGVTVNYVQPVGTL
ncbi:MAG: FxLYD domain-containing protein, partial [Nitrososphaera sp.]